MIAVLLRCMSQVMARGLRIRIWRYVRSRPEQISPASLASMAHARERVRRISVL